MSLRQETRGRLLLFNPVGVRSHMPRPWDTSSGLAGGESMLYVCLWVEGSNRVIIYLNRCILLLIVPKCPIGMQYKECTKACSTTCHSLNIQEVCKEQCVDGCACPGKLTPTTYPSFSPRLCVSCCNTCVECYASVGKVLDGNRCVEVSQCSCVHMGRHFPPGSTISQDCNTW